MARMGSHSSMSSPASSLPQQPSPSLRASPGLGGSLLLNPNLRADSGMGLESQPAAYNVQGKQLICSRQIAAIGVKLLQPVSRNHGEKLCKIEIALE